LKLSLERNLALVFGAAAGMLLLLSVLTWWNIARFQDTRSWVEHTREVLQNLEQARSELLTMQASARGFVLTGSEEVLEPYAPSARALGETLAALHRLTGDNPDQQARLAELQPLVASARARLDERVGARRARGVVAVGESSAYLDGQRAVEAVRALIGAMIQEERALLDRRLTRSAEVGKLTMSTTAAASLLAIGLVLVASRHVQRDLRRRGEAEAALQASFARIEDLYNHAPCGYHSVDRNGGFVEINDTALQWLGYTRDEVVGRLNFADILTPESAGLFRARFEHFVRVGAVENVEYDWRRKDGRTLAVLLNATAIYDAAGNYVASRATVFDVTLRKRAEEERDRFFTLSGDLLCVAASDGFFKRVNAAWQAALGFTPAELLARPILDFVHPDDRSRTEEEMGRLARGQESDLFENRYVCRDGSYRWLSWSARPVPGEQLIYASARDVTAAKAAEERIQRLNRDLAQHAADLEAANAELESFSYSVSHDLRAPLRHIDGFASLLTKQCEGKLDEQGRRFISIISQAAKQMGTLIDDLLAFSRVNRTPIRLEPVDQAQLVASVISDGHYNPDGRKIRWNIGPLPPAKADAAMLRQVWINLIDNAVKYSRKQPESVITISGITVPTAGEYVFSVRDNGVGFDMTYADKLFGVFQRLHGEKEFEGTGIGLANVRRIVARHGGRTWAESQVNEGATFYFSLPVSHPPSPPSK
jgi:PAS domain S-box-containing protein